MAKIEYRISRRSSRLFLPTVFCLLAAAIVIGCSTTLNRNATASHPPIIRVRLLLAQERLTISASQPPIYRTESDTTPHVLRLPKNAPVVLSLTAQGWSINSTILGSGTLTIQPSAEGTVAIAAQPTPTDKSPAARPYRGQYRFVPVGPTKFDVVNDVDIEGYLAGVLPRELFKNWHEETYKAQAIIARTYALYEKASNGNSAGRYWDVFADERSQVYGGMLDETDKSRMAVNETQGVVVAHGAEGQEPIIFKAYFSSTCGGVTQSGSEAFGDPTEALQEHNNYGLCNASPKFSWGPVVIGKDELTRRVKVWGAFKKRPERDMGQIREVTLQKMNAFGRPTRFSITDSKGLVYSLQAEEFRSASNWDAANPAYAPKSGKPPTLYSSFVKVITDADSIRFVEGHGWGHGVGMCQWCAERQAEEGMAHEDIVLAAYPHTKQVRAY